MKLSDDRRDKGRVKPDPYVTAFSACICAISELTIEQKIRVVTAVNAWVQSEGDEPRQTR